MLGTVISHQRFCDRLRTGCDLWVTKGGQFGGIPFSGQDGVHDRQAGYSGKVADNVMDLDIHLVESFLHVLDVNSGHPHQALAVSPDGAHGADGLWRAMRGSKEANRM